MKKIVFLATLVASSALSAQKSLIVSAPRDTASRVSLTSLVDNNIDFLFFAIAGKANLEASFCMVGNVDSTAKTSQITELRLTSIDSASSRNAHFRTDGCTKPDVIGTLHFHPGVGLCRMSDMDIQSARDLGWPITAIACREKEGDRPKLVVLFKEEIEKAWQNINRTNKAGVSTPEYRYRKPH